MCSSRSRGVVCVNDKFLTIAWKTLKEAFRQPKNLVITLGLPLAFMVIFGLAFGGAEEETYALGVVDEDATELSRAYVDGLRAMAYASGKPMFELALLPDEAGAREAVEKSDLDAALVVPRGFMERALPSGTPPQPGLVPPVTQQPGEYAPPEGAVVAVLGDPSRVSFQVASQAVAAFTVAFAEEVSGQKPAVSAATRPVTAPELTPFDFIAPGLMVFAILNIIPQAASALARESESKTLDRVRMSPTSAASLLSGVALAQVVLACVSLALMLGMARVMGFHNQGSYATAYLIAIGAAVAATGLGLIIAAFARTQQEAANLGVAVAVPASFLSGAFFSVPGVRLFGSVELYDVLPTTHAIAALRQVMTLGRPVETVTGALVALALLGLLYFLVGVGLYRRTRLAAE